MPTAPGRSTPSVAPAQGVSRALFWGFAGLIAALSVTIRVKMLVGARGLYGLGNYDDGVHYAGAAGLVNGLWPYRDFLFLHPPGIIVALQPFAALGELTSDPTGMLAARIAWWLLGGVNAFLIILILRPLGVVGALLGGLWYAMFATAAYSEWTALLEGLATTCLLGCLLIGRVFLGAAAASPRRLALAGALLGVGASIKIWGVVPALVLAGWLLFSGERRRGGALLLGSVAGCAVVCLPFFLAAPRAMWEMVVWDQLGRRRAEWIALDRLNDLAGLSSRGIGSQFTWLLVVFGVVFVSAAVLAWLGRAARPVVILTGFLIAVLMVTPFWFLHYACLVAAPTALILGAGAQEACVRVGARSSPVALIVAGVLLLGTVVYNAPSWWARAGRDFAGPQLRTQVAGLPGCITSDDPMALIQMDVLTRNVDRGCRFVVDLGGRSYDRSSPEWGAVSRARNRPWQAYALRYLRSGSYSISVRFWAGQGYSRATAEKISRWPVAVRADRWVVRVPQP
jgi:alpha-1,2-mannosyltransferase